MPPDAPSPSAPDTDIVVRHRPEAARFEVEIDGHLSLLTYQLDPARRRVAFDHTGVPALLQGRGIAAALARQALAWAEAEGLQVLPRCSYVAVYMRRHPETRPLLEPRG